MLNDDELRGKADQLKGTSQGRRRHERRATNGCATKARRMRRPARCRKASARRAARLAKRSRTSATASSGSASVQFLLRRSKPMKRVALGLCIATAFAASVAAQAGTQQPTPTPTPAPAPAPQTPAPQPPSAAGAAGDITHDRLPAEGRRRNVHVGQRAAGAERNWHQRLDRDAGRRGSAPARRRRRAPTRRPVRPRRGR